MTASSRKFVALFMFRAGFSVMLIAAISFPCKPHYSRLVCQRPAPVVGRTSTLQSVSPYSKFQLTGRGRDVPRFVSGT